MSKTNAQKFITGVKCDSEFKTVYSEILKKYRNKKLSNTQWKTVFEKEIIPYAKKHGYDFTLQDLESLDSLQKNKLNDEMLDHVVGGAGFEKSGIEIVLDEIIFNGLGQGDHLA